MKYKEIQFDDIDTYKENGIILLVTATKTETTALHNYLQPIPDIDGILEVKKENSTYYLGIFGKYLVAHVECLDMGSISSGGSIITISNAINNLKPKFVMMVGIAFGIDKLKQNIGDVLISKKIIPYEVQRIGNDVAFRGAMPESSNYLRDCFKNLREWEYLLPNCEKAKLEVCDILSGEKLIDDIDYRENLQKAFPTANGGEMEGAGLYSACFDKDVKWILIKSICDYADGEKKEGKEAKQQIAINSALHACLSLFEKEFVFEGLGTYPYQRLNQIVKKNPDTNLSIAFFKSRLNNISKLINKFKAQSALDEIETLKTQIQLADIGQKNDLLADCIFWERKSNFLLAISNEDLNDLFLKAIESTEKVEYKEDKILILSKKGQINESIDCANSILIEDAQNPVAWALKDSYTTTKESPISVRDNEIYKSVVITITISKQKNNISKVELFDDLMFDDLQKKVLPKEITVKTLNYWFHFSQYAFQRFSKPTSNHLTYIEDSKQNPNLEYANQLFKLIESKLNNSEIKNCDNYNIARFNENLTSFLITGDKSFVFKMYDEFVVSRIKNEYPYLQHHIILSLFAVGETQKIFDLIELLDEEKIIPQSFFTCAMICKEKEGLSGVVKFFELYLKNVKVIDENNLIAVIGGFEELHRLNVPVAELVAMVEKIETFEKMAYRKLTLSSIYRFSKEFDSQNLDILTELIEREEINSIKLKGIVALCLFAIKETQKAKDYVETFWNDVDISFPSSELSLYIEILATAVGQGWAREGDSEKLLNLLVHWRKNFPPNEKYIWNELVIYLLSRKYVLVEEIALFGYENFDEGNKYFIHLLNALCLQPKTEATRDKIDKILDDKILNLQCSTDEKLNIIQLCFENSKDELGAELFYQTVKSNPNDRIIKSKYNFNQYFLGEGLEKKFPNPEHVEIDCYVKFTLNDREYFEQITIENIDKFPFLHFLGKEVNDEFIINDFSMGSSMKFKILDIFNKYIGLKIEIYKEISNSELYNGIQVLELNYIDGKFDIDDFEKKIKEICGAQGTKNQFFWNEKLEQYEKLEIGFLELSIFSKDPCGIYYFLRLDKYFPVLPIFRHQKHEINSETKFILDFTSLLLLFNLSKGKMIDLNSLSIKLLVVPTIYEFLEENIKNIDINSNEKISINVTLDGITPNFHHQEYEKQRLTELESLLEWIKQNCELANLENNLPLMIQLNDNIEFQNSGTLFRVFVETVLLSMNPNHLVISEDITTIKKVSNLISTEYFLAKQFKKDLSNIIAKMLSWNYRGLSVNAEILYFLFNQDALLNDYNSTFQKAIKYSLTSWNPNLNNLKEVLDFILIIYQKDFDIKYKRHITKTVFHALLKDNYLDINISLKYLESYINKKLVLSQFFKDCIIEDFKLVEFGLSNNLVFDSTNLI